MIKPDNWEMVEDAFKSSLQKLGEYMWKHIGARGEEILRNGLEFYIKVKEEKDGKNH